MGEQFFSDLR